MAWDELIEMAARLTPQWMAGFFDGEGSVIVEKPSKGNPLPYIRATVTQCNPVLLALIAVRFKASSGLNLARATKHSRSDCYQVLWFGERAQAFLAEIKDFVIGKRPQVELGLEMLNLIGNGSASRRHEIYDQMQMLKGHRHEPQKEGVK